MIASAFGNEITLETAVYDTTGAYVGAWGIRKVDGARRYYQMHYLRADGGIEEIFSALDACPNKQSLGHEEEEANQMKYEPWTNGYAVGFKCTAASGNVSFVYLNPSSEDSEGSPNVFVYCGPNGDPVNDNPATYVEVSQ